MTELPETVQLIADDFIGSVYTSRTDCPLARALKRAGLRTIAVWGRGIVTHDLSQTFNQYEFENGVRWTSVTYKDQGKQPKLVSSPTPVPYRDVRENWSYFRE